LTRAEVIAAIERKRPPRIPLIMAKWWGEGLGEQYGDLLSQFDEIPNDTVMTLISPPMPNPSELSWRPLERNGVVAHDAGGLLPDWKNLDEYVEKMPTVTQEVFEAAKNASERAKEEDRYFLWGWWSLFFERPWGLRGMAHLLMDYFDHPEKIHKLHDCLCNQYERLIDEACQCMDVHGFWTSDDLGHQTQLMMTPTQFREFLKPYYARIGEKCREYGLHFWLHSCGNNTDVLEDLIEVGVDVFHPVQKHTMDEKRVAQEYGDRLAFLVGFDVQHILQEGTPDDVRAEVRHLVDIFDREEGGMCIAAGNGIVAGTPIENIQAFLSESLLYGRSHRQGFGSP